jgi:hypothetical protein
MPSSRSRPDLGVRRLKGWQNQATERLPSVLVLVWAALLVREQIALKSIDLCDWAR